MKPLLLLLISSFFFTACATPFVARLDPQTEVFSYRNGEKLVSKDDGQARVAVSYYDSSPKYVVFHLEVENIGEETFDFDPASSLMIGDVGPVRQAIDPELQLLSMDMKSVKEVRTFGAFDIASIALTAAGTVLAANEGVTDGAFYAGSALNLANDLSFILTDDGSEEAIARGEIVPLGGAEPAPDNRYFWLDYALRITTIAPGKSVYGKLAFDRNDEAENMILKVIVRGEEFSFPFSQKLFKA